jgi:predicted ribosomally synthesized peptide with SipW-like signal peptide
MATSHTRAQRVKGLIAGACGAALLLAGGTWALWYDSEDVTGATITAGNLDIAKAPSEVAFDVSVITGTNDSDHVFQEDNTPTARKDQGRNVYETYPGCFPESKKAEVKGHYIDLREQDEDGDPVATWHAVPGDTVSAVWPYAVALDGDNLVADLKLVAKNKGTLNTTFYESYLASFQFEIWYKTVGANGAPAFGTATVGADSLKWLTSGAKKGVAHDLVTLQALNEDLGVNDPDLANPPDIIPIVALETIPATLTAADANVCLVMTATFKGETPKQKLVGKDLLKFADFSVVLEQTREKGLGNF